VLEDNVKVNGGGQIAHFKDRNDRVYIFGNIKLGSYYI